MIRDGNYQEIPIPLQGFDGRGFRYRVGGIFRRGRLILDEQPVKRQRRRYTVRDNEGREVQIHLKLNGIDPIPKLDIAGKVIHLATPLTWYQYAWVGTIQDLSLDAPFDFDPDPTVSKIPQQSLELARVDSMGLYKARGEPNGFTVGVAQFAYKSGAQVSLDGAVKGGMSKRAALESDSSPQYSFTLTTISGLDARTASYRHQTWWSGRTVQVDLVCAARALQYWCVWVTYLNDASATDAARILRSVSIRP